MASEAPWQAAIRRFAQEARVLYGARLDRLVLYGSRARGDAADDSDVDILVVLDSMDSVYEELRRLDPVASRLSLEYDVVLTVVPVAVADFIAGENPLLLNVRREGVPIG